MNRVAIFFILLILLNSCHYIVGSGNMVSEKRAVENFKELIVKGPFDVQVKTGSVTEVVVQADDNIIKYIKTTTKDGVLTIKTKKLHNFSNAHMNIYITTPVLYNVKASAAAEVSFVDVLQSDGKLSFTASSGAEIVSAVKAPEVETAASSGASIKITGKTKNYYARASSGSDIKTKELLSENTTVNASSGASIKVHASVHLKANASSGGDVTYHGAADIDKTISSGGSVEKEN